LIGRFESTTTTTTTLERPSDDGTKSRKDASDDVRTTRGDDDAGGGDGDATRRARDGRSTTRGWRLPRGHSGCRVVVDDDRAGGVRGNVGAETREDR
jgi:hypothetical protein